MSNVRTANARSMDETAEQIAKTVRLATHVLDVPSADITDVDRLCDEVLPDTVSDIVAEAYGRAWAPKDEEKRQQRQGCGDTRP